MTLIKRSNDLFPTFFDDFFGRDWFINNNNDVNRLSSVPAVNIIDNADNYEVEMAVPGLNKNDFKIELDHKLLTISFEKEHEVENEDKSYTKREFSYQSFKRLFTLPQTVESDKIAANYHDGILNITIPKREEAKQKPSRLIAVS